MKNKKLNYVTLFSSAGVGCFGFKQNGFDCIVTNELLSRRLEVQKYNNICKYETGYICGDIQENHIKNEIYNQIELYLKKEHLREVDVILATPPCQGMSVANHKKNNEKSRNSLVTSSIEVVKTVKPKFFIFENVRSFLKTICTDLDGQDRLIKDAINLKLGGDYNILHKVVNFKDYGNRSSRTRTLVIGVRKDLPDVTPYDIFPDKKNPTTLKETIGHFKSLNDMGEMDSTDPYHRFRPYAPHMRKWITNTTPGQSAFENKSKSERPHKVINGKIVVHTNKNGDKYRRCKWEETAPCIHTRNDILASQSTVHPVDDRVFSIRELMEMMTIPASFKWSRESLKKISLLSELEKENFIKKQEPNIRQSIGEAVPTVIFYQIANKIKKSFEKKPLGKAEINRLILSESLHSPKNILAYIGKSKLHFTDLFKIAELANAKRLETSAYYTRQDICFSLIKELPDFSSSKKVINIIEPSVGVGNFLPLLFSKYQDAQLVNLDVVDINKESIEILKAILKKNKIPQNFNIRFIHQDFLLNNFDKRYDIAIGNPPFGKVIKQPDLLKAYKQNKSNTKTINIFSYFIEECLKISDTVALISPKSLLSAPEFSETRRILSLLKFQTIIDYGEKGFPGVKIETVSFVLNRRKKLPKNNTIKIESYIKNKVAFKEQAYIFDDSFPYWLIYRDDYFDKISSKMNFDVYNVYRDRKITKRHTSNKGAFRVLKSRNIDSNSVNNIPNYDSFIDDLKGLDVAKFLNKKNVIAVPNLTYKPRATKLPKNSIADGSVALLTPKESSLISKKILSYYATDEFRKFYMIARNFGSRSLNIDKSSVFFFGINKKI